MSVELSPPFRGAALARPAVRVARLRLCPWALVFNAFSVAGAKHPRLIRRRTTAEAVWGFANSCQTQSDLRFPHFPSRRQHLHNPLHVIHTPAPGSAADELELRPETRLRRQKRIR